MLVNNSEEFLKYLKEIRRGIFNLRSSNENSELDNIVKNAKDKLYVTPDFLNTFDYQHIDKIIQANINRFYENIPSELKQKIRNVVSIGGLELGRVNAGIVKHSKQNFYAVLINYGLVLYLTKFFSYLYASTDLSKVMWCDKCSKNELTESKIIQFTDELADNYLKHGIPAGPALIVEKDIVDYVTFFTDLSIQFIICHELGHFLNGDCDSNLNFSEFGLMDEIQILDEDKDENIELKADVSGYEILKYLSHDSDINLYGLYLFFIAMDWLYKRPLGGSHPNPIERYTKIVEQFYNKNKQKEEHSIKREVK